MPAPRAFQSWPAGKARLPWMSVGPPARKKKKWRIKDREGTRVNDYQFGPESQAEKRLADISSIADTAGKKCIIKTIAMHGRQSGDEKNHVNEPGLWKKKPPPFCLIPPFTAIAN